MRNDIEKVLCAAIHLDDGMVYTHQPTNIKTGFVVAGLRHHNCGYTVYALTGDLKKRLQYRQKQGFLTTSNRFLNRNEAYILAYSVGQIANLYRRKELASEDLY
jgi:hypothetical protein